MPVLFCSASGGCFTGESWTDRLDIGCAALQCGEPPAAGLVHCVLC